MTRAIGYLRVSGKAQESDGLGLDIQRDHVRAHAASHNLDLVEIVQEAASGGVSGDEVFSYSHRPKLLELKARAERGEYEILVVARYDRLSRDHPTLIILLRQLQKHGVEVQSAAEETNGDGPIAEFMRGQLALVAQLERAMIAERLSAGKAKAKTKGRHVHGRVAYGYTSSHGVLEPDATTAPIVKRIFKDARDGWSPLRIARALTKDGIATPQSGTAWSPNSVRRILHNDVYIGVKYGQRKAHPAIVTAQAFNRVAAL